MPYIRTIVWARSGLSLSCTTNTRFKGSKSQTLQCLNLVVPTLHLSVQCSTLYSRQCPVLLASEHMAPGEADLRGAGATDTVKHRCQLLLLALCSLHQAPSGQ